jgi:uncharacterized protein YbaP (TraB family)
MRVSRRGARVAALALALVAGGACAASPAPASAASAPSACPPAAPVPTPEQLADGMRHAVDSGLLWKATKGGRTVYLYGTIHVARFDWAFPGPHVVQAVRASDVIALELDMTDPDVLAHLRLAIASRPGAPALPEALQRRMRVQMDAACIAPETLAPMRPEMQAVTLEVMQGRASGLYADYGIDGVLAGMGRAMKKPLRSLETPESQTRLLVSDDPAETQATVGAVMDELEGGSGPQMLQRLAGDWQRGDLADLGSYASWCGCLDTPQQRADFVKLVDERNPLMADKIVQWHAAGQSLFVAVGSLHMLGDVGLPALLKARGFQVERVALAAAH